MDQFANDTPERRDEAFREAEARLGLPKAIIEKDFWVCWSLRQLFALPSFGDHMIFKGGSSLSKAYHVIHRFSEDFDLSLDRAQLGFESERDPENPDLSGRRRKQLLQEMQDASKATVPGPILAGIKGTFDAALGQNFSLAVDPADVQTLLFAYPPMSDNLGSYANPWFVLSSAHAVFICRLRFRRFRVLCVRLSPVCLGQARSL